MFLSKTSRACSSFFVIVHASAPYDTTGFISDILVKFWADSLLLLCVLLAGSCQYFWSHK
jgi:hypothetical protein